METLKDKQIEAIKQMLNLNQPASKVVAAEPVWKILIYDRCGQDIISPLVSVKELREMGVTLHVQLHADRDSIPDVPAVYFCLPSAENLARIGQDLQNNLYDAYHLNFISPISRQRLEELAAAALQSNCVSQISKVYDQYLNFISLEDDMFTLRHQSSDPISYYSINKADVADTEMESIMDTIVDSLFSVFATLGAVPYIRSPPDNAAAMVAEKLDKKLRENLGDTRNNLFIMDATKGSQFRYKRPLLIILDRNMDMATPLHHTWTYQALAHDVLDLTLNRVVVEETMGRPPSGSGSIRAKTRACDLDSRDKFWVAHKGSPFPTVAEAIQEELEQYRSSEEEVKMLKASMGLDNESDAAFSMVSETTAKLTSAVNSLPQLMEKKRLIDMHTTIATAILNHIKTRRLDTFFEFEEKIMSKATLDKSIMEMLSDTDSSTPEDKMRLFLVFYICAPSVSEAEFDRYAAALQNAGCDLSPLNYIKRWKAYTKMAATQNHYVGAGTKTVSMFSKLMSQGSSFVMEGVKNLVLKKHKLTTRELNC
ncbi:protein sly1 homolog isoform X2 [Hetaerina americana]|uniref:protein sly1 homolog isoform X2 n=1 Tax=Hetaerina americana TaxID=62018 RepID=UPI003A7F351A